ncbi:hypothetical protein B9G98_01930 [Wickerhamiella sorbophila]|uniref:Uncharacterized protein n=1 Tax=Wickerhamiella sorbophila TaxID=45607 RepID=A0A2T0FH56_9ASCO|nr:hypothetical protein B9G98_01930 [Wickerhamiella sorbophila]PRT54310.1 hypothetical protein B9G98_01930 [Wickerhamiella sorbophila]
MDVFKAMWRPRGNISIPTYKQGDQEDGADLQVKSLFYMFRRLRIANNTYMPGSSLKQLVEPIPELSDEDLANLDKMYNLAGFEHVLLHDPHRVLVDWVKNRFRCLLLLSHMPQMDLPKFPDQGFRFAVLPPDASTDEYIRTLTESDIYREHPLTPAVRRSVAESVLKKHNKRDLNSRAQIIQEYLWGLGVEIQVARLYKASLKAAGISSPIASPTASPTASPMGSPTLSSLSLPPGSPTAVPRSPAARSPSPIRIKATPKVAPPLSPRGRAVPAPSSPIQRLRTPSPSKSPTRIRLSPTQPSAAPASPTLRVRQSVNNLKSPPKLSKPEGAVDSTHRQQILKQARQAVFARMDKEKSVVALECSC